MRNTDLATYQPARRLIRVVVMKRSPQLFVDNSLRWVAFFCADPKTPAKTIIEVVADRSAIEHAFHDMQEVHARGQQQARTVWSNVCWKVCVYAHHKVR